MSATTGYQVEVAQLEYHVTNLRPLPPKLEYSSPSLVFYKYMDRIFEPPKYNGFTNFNIQPSLPSGILMNFENGILYGTVQALQEPTNYTITALYSESQETARVTVEISFVVCSLPSIHLEIEKMTSRSGDGHTEQFQLYDSKEQLLLDSVGPERVKKDAVIQKYHFCVPQDLYTIHSYSTTSSGWLKNNFLKVYLYRESESTLISMYTLWNADHESFTFNTHFEELHFIHVLNNSTATLDPSVWTADSFDDSEWSVYEPSRDGATKVTGITYIRQAFTVNAQNPAQSYQLYYRARAGSVVYLDGQELYRVYVPDGAITPQTRATTSESEQAPAPWRYYTNIITSLTSGRHLFCIVLVPQSDHVFSLNYDTYLMVSFTSHINTRTLEVETESSSYNPPYGSFNAFDFNMYTSWEVTFDVEHPAPQYVQSRYLHGSMETINKYCIGSHWQLFDYNPSSWTLEGSNDGEEWTVLDVQEEIEFTRYSDHLCYYMMNQDKPYNQFRFNCYQAFGGDVCSVAEIHLYSVDYSQIQIPPLSYKHSSLQGFINITMSSGIPTTDYYHNYTISPALPSGLKLSKGNGVISGVPRVASDSNYTITAYGPDKRTYTTMVHISTVECIMPLIPVTLIFENMNYDSSHNGYQLVDNAHKVLDETLQFATTIDTWYSTYCLEPSVYELVLLDDSNDGWGTGKVTIQYESNNVIETNTCRYGESPKSVYFTTAYKIYPKVNDYKYFSSEQSVEPAPDWYILEYIPENWSSGIPGQFKDLAGVTQYYRALFLLTDVESYSAFNVMVKTQVGLVLYINGIRYYKVNMPETWTSKTRATAQFSYPQSLYVSGSLKSVALRNGRNSIAVEVHSYGDLIDTSFDASLLLSLDHSKRSVDGDVSSSIPGYQDETRVETAEKAFDGSYTTKYYAPSCDGEISLMLLYKNNRAEYITSMAFTRGNSKNKMPDYLKLLGSNDQTHFDVISIVNGLTFGPYGSVNGTRLLKFYNDKAYSSYKLIMKSSSCTDGLEAAEIEFFADILGVYCEGDNGYPSVLDGQISYKDCPEFYHGYYYKVCENGTLSMEHDLCYVAIPQPIQYSAPYYTFSYGVYNTTGRPYVPAAGYKVLISPNLPEGLTIGLRTGIISGTLSGDCTASVFTVKVVNSAGSSEGTFVMNCIPRQSLSVWAQVVLYLLAFMVLGLGAYIGYGFYKRRTSVKRKKSHMRSLLK